MTFFRRCWLAKVQRRSSECSQECAVEQSQNPRLGQIGNACCLSLVQVSLSDDPVAAPDESALSGCAPASGSSSSERTLLLLRSMPEPPRARLGTRWRMPSLFTHRVAFVIVPRLPSRNAPWPSIWSSPPSHSRTRSTSTRPPITCRTPAPCTIPPSCSLRHHSGGTTSSFLGILTGILVPRSAKSRGR